MLKTFSLETQFNDMVSITEEIRAFVRESNIKSGTCLVFNPHTTAAITVTSFWDPLGLEDLKDEITRLVPTKVDFKHQHDTPQDAAGHVKSSMVGVSMSFIISDGDLLLGGSQGIYFWEFDGPRKRKFHVKLMRD